MTHSKSVSYLPPAFTRSLTLLLLRCSGCLPSVARRGRLQAKTASVSATDEFSFHVIVKDQNMDKLRDFVDAISDPKNEMYGESMTAEEVSAFTAPAEADTKTVMQWLEQVNNTLKRHASCCEGARVPARSLSATFLSPSHAHASDTPCSRAHAPFRGMPVAAG